MRRYDLCLAWNWEYDADFVHLFIATCTIHNRSLIQVTPETLEQTLIGLEREEVIFTAFLDRASDSDLRFRPLADWVSERGILYLNSRKQALRTHDKAVMHMEFSRNGLSVPYTIILPSHNDQASIDLVDLDSLEGSFVIKPAGEGGGEGVILEATSWKQVLDARQQFPHEKYLLQAHIIPRMLDRRPAWFRVLACDGAVYPCWWDPYTHVYTRVSAEEKFRFGLRSLSEIPLRIAQLYRLDLFSTEIALTREDQFLVVDYVNDPLDLRLQSKCADGVPNAIVVNIAERLTRMVGRFSSTA